MAYHEVIAIMKNQSVETWKILTQINLIKIRIFIFLVKEETLWG